MAKVRGLDGEQLLAALKAANESVAVAAVPIPSLVVDGEPVEFDVRGLTFEELMQCRQRATRGNVTDEAILGAEMVLMATVPEDRAALWGNEALQKQYGVATPRALVGKLLMGGAGLMAVQAINRLSASDQELEELVKSVG